MEVEGAFPSYKIISLRLSAARVSFFRTGKKRISWHGGLVGISKGHLNLKGAVSRQSGSFCLICQLLALNRYANDKIRDPRQTNMSPEHYF